MRYLHSMIRVRDLETSLHFFCDILGLKETKRTESKQGRFTLIFLAAPGDEAHAKAHQSPVVELTYNWPDEKGETEHYDTGRNFGHLAFEVDDIYTTCQHLMDHGITINRPPRDGYMAFIKTPDNISIELLQKGEKRAPQEPWASMENTGSW